MSHPGAALDLFRRQHGDGEKTVAIATFTQTSIGPSSASARSAAFSTAAASATSVGMGSARTPLAAQFVSRSLEPSGIMRQQRYVKTLPCEFICRGAADARASAPVITATFRINFLQILKYLTNWLEGRFLTIAPKIVRGARATGGRRRSCGVE